MPGTPSSIAQVKRDLGAISSALGTVGGGGSPNELRSDLGIQVGVGVEETLKRHVDLINSDVEDVTASPVAGNATTASVFSFPEDHYILGVGMVANDVTRLKYGVLSVRPQGQSEEAMICHTLLADFQGFDSLPMGSNQFLVTMDGGFTFPLFGRAETDYTWAVRSEAAGGVIGTLSIYRVRAPQGVEIAH